MPRPLRKTPPAPPRSGLRCERLEDRVTPATANAVYPAAPATGTELLGQMRSAVPLQDLSNAVAFLGLEAGVDVARAGVVLGGTSSSLVEIPLRPGADAAAVTAALQATGLFEWLAANGSYAAAAYDLREFVPNDPKFPDQFHHPIIGTPAAWNGSLGAPTVIVAVIDDGVQITHPDLKDNIYSNPLEVPNDGIDNDGNGLVDDAFGWDFVNNSPNVNPDDPLLDTHGTRVAGLIGGRIDNGQGVAGVAGRATILPLKVIGNRATTSLAFAKAVGYAVAAGAKVINNSLDIDAFANDPVFRAAIQFAYARGVLWVNSAGNANVQNPVRQNFDDMLLVAATDRTDRKTGYSNYGTGIDLAAPGGVLGDGLVTTDTNGGYTAALGTSMAAALVSGTAALIWSANPSLTRDQVAALILGTADDLAATNPAFLDRLGAGRLDAGGAVGQNFPATRLGRLLGLPDEGQAAPQSLSTFTLRLVSNLDPATVVPANFELRWAGPDNAFGTSDDGVLPLTLNDGRPYLYGTNQLVFGANATLAPGLYRFTARAGGLRDPFGRPVDGDGNGTPGGNLVRNFGIAAQVSGTVREDTDNSGGAGPGDPGVPGQTVYGDLNNNGRLDGGTFAAGASGVAVPDNNAGGVSIPVVVSGLDGTTLCVTVSVLVTHPSPSDLTITLVGPSGERVVLFRNRPLPRMNPGQSTMFLFEDGVPETEDVTPSRITRTLNPDEPLSRFHGTEPNGTWRVEVTDTTPQDTGVVNGATVSIMTEPCAVTDAFGGYILNGLPPNVSVPILLVPEEGWRVTTAAATVVWNDRVSLPPVTVGVVRLNAVYGRVTADVGRGAAGAGLFLDRNGNGTRDGFEPTATTDAAGNYVFAGVAPGGYSVRLLPVPGYATVSPAARPVSITPAVRTSTGNNFALRKNTGRVGATVDFAGPEVRNTPVGAVGLTATEPVVFDKGNVTLTRNGVPVALDVITVLGTGPAFTVTGLAGPTAADGEYVLTVAPAGPPGEPGRAPEPIVLTWRTDTTPPAAALTKIVTLGVTAARITFTEPVTGLELAHFRLYRDGVELSPVGVTLTGSGAAYRLENLAPLTRAVGAYELRLVAAGSGVVDAAGNGLTADAATTWAVTLPLPLPPVPRAGVRTAVGAAAGGGPIATVYDGEGRHQYSVFAFDVGFTGGVRVATGDVNGDGFDDLIAAPGPGGGPRVRAFDGRDGRELFSLAVFEDDFTGGLYVSAADFTGDGIADFAVSADVGGGPRVTLYDGATLRPLADFLGIDDPAFRGGARTAAGDVNGDGAPDLVVAAGFGGGPRVAGFDGRALATGDVSKRVFADFFAVEDTLRNGVYVAVGDFTADGFADVVVGGGPSGGPRVLAYSGRALVETGLLEPVMNFFAGPVEGRGGVRVSAKDVDNDGVADLYTGSGDGQGSTVRRYNGLDLRQFPDEPPFTEFDAFENFPGGVFVG